jgi:hypothetical protein
MLNYHDEGEINQSQTNLQRALNLLRYRFNFYSNFCPL